MLILFGSLRLTVTYFQHRGCRQRHGPPPGPPSPRRLRGIVTSHVAGRLTREGAGGGCGDEDIRVHQVPFGSVFEWLETRRAEGALVDPKVYGALALAAHRMGRAL